MRLQRHDDTTAAFGAGGPELLVLHASSSAPRVQGTTGLYHFAILVPSRPDLARALRHLAQTRTVMQGFADHFVSEAIYLADPDGNGIEIYRDRPREDWPMKNGAVQMASDPLDIESLLAEAGFGDVGRPAGRHDAWGTCTCTWRGFPETERFYVEGLGLDLMARFGASAIVSVRRRLPPSRGREHLGRRRRAASATRRPRPEARRHSRADRGGRARGRRQPRARRVRIRAQATSLSVADPAGNRFEVLGLAVRS